MARMDDMRRAIRGVFLRPFLALRGGWPCPDGLGRAARFAPLPVVLVPPKVFFDQRLNEVIRVAPR